MEVAVAYSGTDAAVVSVRGQLDVDTAPALHSAFEELSARAVTMIVIDLTGLEFCDSIGLSTFVVAHRRCVDSGGWVRVAGPTPFLARLLSVVGVADAVPMYRSVEAAQRADPAQLIRPVRDDLAA
jgi:anti-anti-sigma factor